MTARVFTQSDQLFFAQVSGDYNPMHMDRVAARRTQAGQPAVHGVHGMLWALEHADHGIPWTAIKSRFEHFIFLGDTVSLTPQALPEGALGLDLSVDHARVTGIVVETKPQAAKSAVTLTEGSFAIASDCRDIWDLTIEQCGPLNGTMLHAASSQQVAQAFPALSSHIGVSRVAALATLSRLVGMVCPGLHSIFLTVDVTLVEPGGAYSGIRFAVKRAHAKYKRVTIAVEGDGISGVIECLLRPPPVNQPPYSEMMGWVDPKAFVGTTALIIGGSRGLGEVTAKLIAAGGGTPIITYAMGKDDAQRVAEEIIQSGGTCLVRCYDYGHAAEQLNDLPEPPTHLYYFATPRIARQKAGLYSASLMTEFMGVYNETFLNLCQRFKRPDTPIKAFYPSSVYIDQRPAHMTEYAMAKAAGEVLCADITASLGGVTVLAERLPMMATDQTASTNPVQVASALEVMKPIVLKMHDEGGAFGPR